MAIKNAELLIESDTYEVQNLNEEPEEKNSHDDALEEFLMHSRASGSDAVIIVRKVRDTENPNSVTSLCGQFPVDKYDYFTLQDVIKRKWGGGDYRLFVSSVVNGKRKLRQNQLISIESEIEQKNSSESSEIVALLREVLAKQAPVQQASTSSMLSQVSELAAVMNALRPPERNPLKEFAETMAIMQGMGMMPGGADPEKEINPLWGKLAEALPALVNAATRPAQRRENPAQRKPKAKPEPEQKEKPDMISFYLKQLEQYAVKNAETETVADTIVENAPDFDALIEIIKQDDFITKNTAAGFWSSDTNKNWLADLREWLLGHADLPSKYSDQFDWSDTDKLNGETETGV